MTQRDSSLRTIARFLLTTALLGLYHRGHAAEHHLTSPDGKLAVFVSDDGGLRYRVEVDSEPIITPSKLGLEFVGGVVLGPAAMIEKVKASRHDGSWENHFGNRRMVSDHWKELCLALVENGPLVENGRRAAASTSSSGLTTMAWRYVTTCLMPPAWANSCLRGN